MPPPGFSRQQRLLTAADYKNVFDQARRSSDRFFTVLMRTSEVTHARLGLAIAKKQAKRAVDRNRIKRITRESFRLNQQKLHNIDVVVLARRDTATATNEQLFESLHKHWQRIINIKTE